MKTLPHYAVHYLLPGMVSITVGFFLSLWLLPRHESGDLSSGVQPAIIQLDSSGSVTLPEPSPSRDFGTIYSLPTIFSQLHFAYMIAEDSDLKTLFGYLEEIVGNPDPLFNHNVASILLEKVIEIDPLAALDFVESHQEMNQNLFVSHILTSWVRQDPEPAIDYFTTITNQQLKFSIGARLLEDPTLRMSGLASEVESSLGPYSAQINEQVRLKNMPAATAFEEAFLTTGHRRRQSLMRAMSRWYLEDPDAAMERLAVITNQREKQQLMQVVMSAQAQQDPAKALEMLEIYAPNNQNLKRQALTNFAQQNPSQALPYVEAWISETGKYDLLGRLVGRWIQVDQVAALNYVETIPENQKQVVLQNLAFSYIQQSPNEGMSWLMSLGEEYDHSVKRNAVSALANFPDVAESWLGRLGGEPELQDALLTQLASRMAHSNPSDAYDWLDTYRDSTGFQAARTTVLQTWAQSDPEAVASILEENLTGTGVDQVLRTTVGNWVMRDADAAIDWIESLSDSSRKLTAIQSLMTQIADPQQALPLLEDLPRDDKSRARMLLAQNWLRRQPDDVETIIDELEIEEHNAEALRNQQSAGRIRRSSIN